MISPANIPLPRLPLLGLLATLFFPACAAVTTTEPFGTQPASFEPEEWNGTWAHDELAVDVRTLDPEKGTLRLAWIDDDEDDEKTKMKTAIAHLREVNDWTFISLLNPDAEEEEGLYLWARIELDKSTVLAWMPRPKRFQELVASGKLPGRVEGEDVFLDKLEPAHLSIIASEKEGVLFAWDEPLVFRRVSDD